MNAYMPHANCLWPYFYIVHEFVGAHVYIIHTLHKKKNLHIYKMGLIYKNDPMDPIEKPTAHSLLVFFPRAS